MRTILVFAVVVWSALAQTVTLNESGTVNSSPYRIGLNTSSTNYYDGLLQKNLFYSVDPGFEGFISQSIEPCLASTTLTCVGFNVYNTVTSNYWAGTAFRIINGTTGTVKCSGTIASNTTANGSTTGATYTFNSACGSSVNQSDYIQLKLTQSATTNPTGWSVSGSAAGETTDLPPGTTGQQALNIPTGSHANVFLDSTGSHDYYIFQSGQTFTGKIKAHISSGSPTFTVTLVRGTTSGGGFNCSSGTLTPTSSWTTLTWTCSGTESTGTVYGTLIVQITASGTGSVNVDDIDFERTSNTDASNTTVYRDEYVHALQLMHPGTLRLMEQDNLGTDLANWETDQYGNKVTIALESSGYPTVSCSRCGTTYPTLADFLNLCAYVGASPYINVPVSWPLSDYASLVTWISSNYSFSKVFFELSNEPWNFAFAGLYMPNVNGDDQAPYGYLSGVIGAEMKGASGYSSSVFKIIVNVQACCDFDWLNGIKSTAGSNIDGASIAPYTAGGTPGLTSTSTLDAEWNPEASWAWSDSNNTLNGTYAYGYNSDSSLILAVYEDSTNTTGGTTASVVQAHDSEIMMGTVTMMQMMEHLKLSNIGPQNLFTSLAPSFNGPSAFSVPLWGTVQEVGGEWAGTGNYILRPQALALAIANSAIIGTEYSSAITSNVTYNVPTASNNAAAVSNVPYLSVYCFKSDDNRACAVFNTDPSNSHTLNFTGTNVPTSVTEQLLYDGGIGITANNESATSQVSIKTTAGKTITAGAYTIGPYSMAGLAWNTGQPAKGVSSGNVISSGNLIQ